MDVTFKIYFSLQHEFEILHSTFSLFKPLSELIDKILFITFFL